MTLEIFSAIANNDLTGLRSLLEQGADPDIVQSDIVTKIRPLHAAVLSLEEGGSLEQIDILLEAGADINETSLGIGGGTPLLCALFNDLSEAARYLLDAGADPNVRGTEGDSPLRWSVAKGDYEMAALLLDRGAKKSIENSTGPQGMTALGIAVYRLDAKMVRLLLDAGADPYALDVDLRSAKDNLPEITGSNSEKWHQVFELIHSI